MRYTPPRVSVVRSDMVFSHGAKMSLRFVRLLLVLITVEIHLAGTASASTLHVKVSGNIALIPPSPNVTVWRVPKRNVHVSWQRALNAAKKSWGLTSAQIEVMVRAAVADNNVYARGWAVVADMITPNPAPGSNTVYDKMVILVDGRTGKAVFSYPVDPHPMN
jgi:hypothetical protein